MLIALTQRLCNLPQRAELRDCVDQAWTTFLQKCSIDFFLVPNALADPVSYVDKFNASGLILTGGGDVSGNILTLDGAPANCPDTNSSSVTRDRTETRLLCASIERDWPVLGVCRGMQVLNLFHGGSLVPVDGHTATHHPLTHHPDQALYQFPDVVNSYHNFSVDLDTLGVGLIPAVFSGQYVEAFVHNHYRHLGVMWHPERNTPYDQQDVKLFREFFGVF